ncbi:FusB/FusC family EF-G-binding protein [Paenibacillus sp. GCM10027626]|uniref:FusB/FusC family EF-G-binding protein n=1 Tax=Paenibacillus sp. GCM10027626 TaxID=3273411 RepID=UPI003639DF14
MTTPFIRNHHYNVIKRQVQLLQNACNTVADPKVIEAVRYNALQKIADALPEAADEQLQIVNQLELLRTNEQFQHYLQSLEPYLLAFEPVTENQLKKLFPKVKKLKLPQLDTLDYRYLTYLGWMDIASNKMFLAYRLDGQLVGIEGRYTPLNKKNTCFLCNRHEEVALFSAITKTKPKGASPDYYKSIGNYMCVKSAACNSNITNPETLEGFIREVTGL